MKITETMIEWLAVAIMSIIVLLVFCFYPKKAVAFGDNSYSQYEYDRRHGALKSVMDAQVVRKERHVEVDRSVLMSGQPNKDKSVLVSNRKVRQEGLSEVHSTKAEIKTQADEISAPIAQEMQLVEVETTPNDWIAE